MRTSVARAVRCRPLLLAAAMVAAAGALLTAGEQRTSAGDSGIVVSAFGYMQAAVDGRTEVLPLRHTSVQAEIRGVMSAVKVTQHFLNPYDHPIEAIYVFPLPHRAAVHAMTLRVGTREITAQIRRRAEARALYEQAKKQGRTASLLEQERPNIFTQSVANILPGDAIQVELQYAEELLPLDGEYSFVFPMVVGPRYMGTEEPVGRSGSGWAADTGRVPDASRISPALLQAGQRPGRDISLHLRLEAGLPIRDLRAETHRVTVRRTADRPHEAVLELDPADRIPNRDLVVRYRLSGPQPRAALLAGHESRGGHLLLMVQPKDPRQMARQEVSPREMVFVVDASGSMEGQPISQVKRVVARCLAELGPEDRFRIIRFAGFAEALSDAPLVPSPERVREALEFVNTTRASGGTEFLPALSLALLAPGDPARARIVLFMSDGYIGYEAHVLQFIRARLGGASLFALGVGSSVNRFLIDGMARMGGGEPFYLAGRAGEQEVIRRFFETVSRPALTRITVDWGKLPVSDVTPARVPDLFAGRPLVLTARFTRPASGEVVVRGQQAGEPFEQRLAVSLPGPAADPDGGGQALAYLWARRRIGEWMDRHRILEALEQSGEPAPQHELSALQEQVLSVALRYNLMTRFTSFVAIDRAVRNPGGQAAQANVPLPLPHGVPGSAAPPGAYVSAVASLSTDQLVPGDPEVVITAPPGTVRVTLVFPDGQIKTCTRDSRSGKWVASFLVARDTADGVYTIEVLITLRSGAQLRRKVRYQVDGTSPRVRAELQPGLARPGQAVRLVLQPLDPGLDLDAEPAPDDIGDPTFAVRVRQEMHTARALLPPGQEVDLAHQPDETHAVTFAAPDRPGRYPVPVVARDTAGNKTRQVLWLEVSGAAE